MTGGVNAFLSSSGGQSRSWSWQRARHRPAQNTRRIGLLEHCGTGNLGDDATVAAVLHQIELRWPHASIVGLSLNPADSKRRHGIPSYAIRRNIFPCEQEWSHQSSSSRPELTPKENLKSFLKKSDLAFKIVKSVRAAAIGPIQIAHELIFLCRSLLIACHLDMMIICGGGQLLDWGGPWQFPYTLFKWILLGKLGGVRCLFLNNGAGPLDSNLSRRLVKQTLRLADYVSLRDRASVAFLRDIGFRGTAFAYVDCAWSLSIPAHLRTTSRRRVSEELIVGIAPMAYCDPTRHWEKDEARYKRLIQELAKFSILLLQRGHRLRLFSSDIWFDSQAIADLYTAINENYSEDVASRVICEPVRSIDDLLCQLSQVDCYVTCRFHGVLFAHLLNVPALAIAPHPKVTALMEDVGLSEYCLDIAQCEGNCLVTSFDKLVANMDDVKARIRFKVTQFQRLLSAQFDELFPAQPEGK